jgi:hypothetical protein
MSQEERERVLRGQEKTIPLAERIEEGVAHHEPVTVYFRDGKEHTVEVYALSSRQFRQATKKSGLTPREMTEIAAEFKSKEGLSGEKGDKAWDFFQEIATAAVKQPANILDQLLPNEEAKIALKAVEISQPPNATPPSASVNS